jgi:hypothetical protein
VAKTIQQQLSDAFGESGLTLLELKRLADLKCSPDSLSRKLRGRQSLRSGEIEKLAKALRVQVTAGKPSESKDEQAA